MPVLTLSGAYTGNAALTSMKSLATDVLAALSLSLDIGLLKSGLTI
jgi:hypothetical protein